MVGNCNFQLIIHSLTVPSFCLVCCMYLVKTKEQNMKGKKREELKIMIFKRPSHFDRQHATDVRIYIESKIICKNESNRPNECFAKSSFVD